MVNMPNEWTSTCCDAPTLGMEIDADLRTPVTCSKCSNLCTTSLKIEYEVSLAEEPSSPWYYEHLTRIAKSDYALCADEKDVKEIIVEASRLEREYWLLRIRRIQPHIPCTPDTGARQMMHDLIQEMRKRV